MTVCIGVLCEGGKAAVVAADRLVALENQNLHFDGPEKKIIQIAPRIALLSAGEWPGSSFASRATKGLPESPTVEEIAKSLGNEVALLRVERVEREITQKLFGLTLKQFGELAVRQASQLAAAAYQHIENYSFDIHFLVVGIDSEQAHLLSVNPLGAAIDLSSEGFMAIGAGASLALGILARCPTKEVGLAEAVYRVYEAKKAAEQSLVNKTTDLAVVRPGSGIQFMGEEAILELDRVYKKMRPATLLPEDVEAITRVLGS
jgi:20S proteasome alpha/beta subunit